MYKSEGAPTGDEQSTGQVRGMTRRSVVRTGTMAAWSVPVISVIAAAPAHAVGSGPAKMSVTGAATHVTGTLPINVSGTVTNVGGQDTVNLQLTAVLTGIHYGDTTSSTPGGWTVSTSRNSADKVTFVYTSAQQVKPDTGQPFAPVWTLASSAKNNTGSASIAVTTTGGTPGSATWNND